MKKMTVFDWYIVVIRLSSICIMTSFFAVMWNIRSIVDRRLMARNMGKEQDGWQYVTCKISSFRVSKKEQEGNDTSRVLIGNVVVSVLVEVPTQNDTTNMSVTCQTKS